MGKIVVINHLTLDGVMQAPGRVDEDRRGDFQYGGWASGNNDRVMGSILGERMAQGGPLLLGRRTYENFAAFWPKQADNPFTTALTNTQKYVASTTLQEPLPWSNSTLLNGNVAEAVANLKDQVDKDLVVMGSGKLVRSLMPHNLIDEYILMIHPLVLGTGQTLFTDSGLSATLQLVDAEATTTGVIITTYRSTQSTAARNSYS